ncbi:MAG: D-isomer specific 2-hydroxyacid dehydrogenase NAD-binding protein [Chloroflexi bacterium]|nr:D-isomer specific 2-hydroxyacid dehydrogenase NAD-binding protein [Chloroflexota bacterium]
MENNRPLVVCFEIEDWEEVYLRDRLTGFNMIATAEPLTTGNADLAAGAAVVSIFIHSHLNSEVMGHLPSLRLIATRSTGYDHVDLTVCDERGVAVCNVPTYGENTVAEHTYGLILALSRKIHHAYVRTVRGDFSLEGLRGFDLKGRTLGVVGTGHIGLHVIRIGNGFGMRVLACDVSEQPLLAELLGFHYVPLDQLLRESDIVTLHVPLLPSTTHLINRERLALMKRGCILINTSRGAIVDTDALLWALDEGILAGAGLDVLEGEESIAEERQLLREDVAREELIAAVRGHLLLRRDNVVITPHNAFNSDEALHRILDTTAANVRGFLEERPINLVGA